MNRNALYIPSIDAKDLYTANHLIDQEQSEYGFRLESENSGFHYRRFINTLDFSLDLIQLRAAGNQRLPKKDPLSFEYSGKEYSNKIINVTFKYAYKEFNKLRKNTYAADGYTLNELHFSDSIALDRNHHVIGIVVNTPVKNVCTDLPDFFEQAENEHGEKIYRAKMIPVKYSVEQLRHYLYKNGFTCEGRRYVRFKRSSGSARIGKCLFIDERLYDAVHQWEMCGLSIKEGDEVDLAALEAYISLPTSSIIDVIKIEPKNILVIPDYESNFKSDCIVTEINDEKWLVTSEKEAVISNSIFDGQSLIDQTLMGDFSEYGMLLLRNRFFKSCCFNTNISQWFRDRNITELSQLHRDSITIAECIEDIKLITTPSSIKYAKFNSVMDWLNSIDPVFGVVKHEKKTHFFDGQMVQAHYQLLNTVRLSEDKTKELLAPALKYVSDMNSNPEVFRHHIKCGLLNGKSEYEDIDMSMKDKNEIFFKMMLLSGDFIKTKLYYDFKKDTCKSYIKNMKKGHILIDGNYSVLFGNPYEMLLQTIGRFDGTTSLLPGNIHTSRYPWGKKILGCRSPHISTSNILIANNMKHDLIDRYFNLTEEIVCINSINENILERLSGADFDSDSMIISDNQIIIDAALKYYDLFKVPVNHVSAKKVKRYYSAEDKADLDFRTSNNKIGEIVNLSQELNTIMWNLINAPENAEKPNSEIYESIREIYYDICRLSVMSGIEIDKAKKEFDVNAELEIKKIKAKHIEKTDDGKMVKPEFLGYIAKTKGYYNPEKKCYRYHDTTMDYLVKIISSSRSRKSGAKSFLPFSDCFRFEEYDVKKVKYSQINKIIGWCLNMNHKLSAIWASDYYEDEEKANLAALEKDILYSNINSLKMSRHTLFYLVKCIDNKKYSPISRLLFYALFNYKNLIQELVDPSNAPNTYLVKDKAGDIVLYNIHYKLAAL